MLLTAKDEASDVLSKAGAKIGELGEKARLAALGGLAALGAALVGFGKAGLDQAAQFEVAMARIKAAGVSGAADLTRLADAANKLGAESGLGPTAVAQGLENLVKAGLNAEQALATLPQVIALAQGQMMEMGAASELVVKTVNQFGLEFKDAKTVVDLFATAANTAASSVPELQQALENSAQAARNSGLSLQQTLAALNTLIQNGVPAAEAGEALQNMLLELGNASSTAYQQLLGSSVATKDFNGALHLLAQGGQQARDFIGSFSERAQTAANVLRTAKPFYDDQVKQLTAIGISAEDAAKIMGGTFQSNLNQLTATFGEFWQTLAEPYLPKLSEAFKDATKYITGNRQALSDWLTAGLSPVTQAVDGFRMAWTKLAGDEAKVNEIQQEVEARTAAIGRALNGTSDEYQKAAGAARTFTAASLETSDGVQKQRELVLAIRDGLQTYVEKLHETASSSDAYRYFQEQLRLETARYQEELKKLPPALQAQIQAQEASTAALQQTAPAAQVAAKGIAEISWAAKDALPAQKEYHQGVNFVRAALDAQGAAATQALPPQERLASAIRAYTESAGAGKDKTTQLTEEIARVRQASDGWHQGMNLNIITLNSLRDTVEGTTQKLLLLEDRQWAGEKVEQEVAAARNANDAALARYKQGLEQYVAQAERAVAAAERGTQLGQQEADLYVQRAQAALELAKVKGDANEIQRAENDLLNAQAVNAQAAIAGKNQEIAAYDALIAATQRKLEADGKLDASDQNQLATMADQLRALELEKQGLEEAAVAAEAKAKADRQQAEAAAAVAEASAEAARAAKEHLEQTQQAGEAVTTAMGQARQAIVALGGDTDALTARFDQLQRTTGNIATSIADWMGGTAGAVRQVTQEYESQQGRVAALTATLQQFADTGEYTSAVQQAMAQASDNTVRQMTLLDAQDLGNLRAALDSANAKLKEMQQETEDARAKLAEMNAELLEAQGENQKAELLRQQLSYQERLADIERQRREAELLGNRELMAILDRQAAVLRQINDAKVASIQADQGGQQSGDRVANSWTRAETAIRSTGAALGEVHDLGQRVAGLDLSRLHTQMTGLTTQASRLRDVL